MVNTPNNDVINKNMTQTIIHNAYEEALRLFQAGKLAESQQICLSLVSDYPKILSLLGSIAVQVNRPDIALERFRLAIKADPNLADIHYNLGRVLQKEGMEEEAVSAYKEAVRLGSQKADLNSRYAKALKSLVEIDEKNSIQIDEAIEVFNKSNDAQGNAITSLVSLSNFLNLCGRFEEALIEVDKALDLDPKSAEAYFNKGLALSGQGKIEKSILHYEQALKINPEFGLALNNLGSAYLDLGEEEKALNFHRQATEVSPTIALFWVNLAHGYLRQGQNTLALSAIRRAISLDKFNMVYWKNFAAIISSLKSLDVTGEVINELQYCMQSTELCNWKIRSFAEEIFSRQVTIQSLKMSDDGLSFVNFKEVFLDRSTELQREELSHPLFLTILSEQRLANSANLETFLSTLRRHLLDEAVRGDLNSVLWKNGLPFLCALASQCFLNEYVFWQTEHEDIQIERLTANISRSLKGGQTPDANLIALIGAYRPLGQEPYADLLRQDRNLTNNSPLAFVLKMQIDDPSEERRLRKEIQVVTPIKNEISSKVREQYEQNPYPRWAKPRTFEGFSSEVYITNSLKYYKGKMPQLPESPRILVAGCGSGQEPIELAITLPSSTITALDLSKTSLSYAMRKAREIGVTNIQFGQADILELQYSEVKYDIIVCSGVLHHMKDSEHGLDALLNCLKPGGMMQIGLYSELARHSVVAARKFIVEQGYSVSEQDIRRCRHDVLALPSGHPVLDVTRWGGDFNSISACRDLLFHVQERRFTLSELGKIFDSRGLTFLGFFLSDNVPQEIFDRYFHQFPADPQATNLDNWAIFEQENPDTFRGMYQFWIQKPEKEVAA